MYKQRLSIAFSIALLAMASTSRAEDQPIDKAPSVAKATKGRHLFILSGQSNMHHMDPEVSFIPAVEEALGKENVTVVKHAKRGAPIREWDRDYKWPEDRPIPQGRKRANKPKKVKMECGRLYDGMMAGVKKTTAGKTYETVTFIWMQGETDAGQKLADLYVDSFQRVLARLKTDLKINSMNIVIGRLSDFKGEDAEWIKMRRIQVKPAEDDPNSAWVNTDDLNDLVKDGRTVNGLHYSEEGYKILGERFAEKAIALIKKQNS